MTEKVSEQSVSFSIITGPLELTPILKVNVVNYFLVVTHSVLLSQ